MGSCGEVRLYLVVLLLLGTECGAPLHSHTWGQPAWDLCCTSSLPPKVCPAPSVWLAQSLLLLPIHYKSIVGLPLTARALLHLGMRSILGRRTTAGNNTHNGGSATLPPCTSPHGACCSCTPRGRGTQRGTNTHCLCGKTLEHVARTCYCCSVCNVFLPHACCRVQPTAAEEGSRIRFLLHSVESAVCVL